MEGKQLKELQEQILKNILHDINKLEGYQRFDYSWTLSNKRLYQRIQDREGDGVIIKHAVMLKGTVEDDYEFAQAIMDITSSLFIHYVKGNR